eukprot:11163713-Lingulodinium_polyedra.AAC.1
MFSSLPDPIVVDLYLTAARRGSLGALGREASRQQRRVAEAADCVLLHGACSDKVLSCVYQGVGWDDYLGHRGSAGLP